MPRKKATWTPTYGKWKPEAMKLAMEAVKSNKLGLRQAAKQYSVPGGTLCRRLKKDVSAIAPATRPPTFSAEDERILVQYLQEMESLGFGLGIKAVCKLAYEMAEEAGILHRFNKEKKKAGYDWYQGFMSRHPELSLRKPEGLSAARAAMLNPKTIGDHFTKLGEVLDKTDLKSKPCQIYNLDETGLSLVHTPSKVISTKGKKTVQSRTSADRGENVTVLVCANAQGTVLPPFIIFKGKRLSPGLTHNAPPGTLFGVSNSSFINSELFETWFSRMFIPSLTPSRPVLLILDGHYSHITISTLQLARANSIHIYCLPPHTTNHTQPLDKSVFRSVKIAYNQRCERFMRENPQRLITRYDFCGLFKDVFHNVLTMVNIISGFKSTGIYPFNPQAITMEHMQFSSVDTELEYENPLRTEIPPKPVTVIPVIFEAGDVVVDLPPVHSPSNSEEVAMDVDEDQENSLTENSAVAEAILEEIPHSSTQTPRFSVLKKPVVKKIVKATNANSKRVTQARCLTADEIYNAEVEKQKKKEKELAEKEARKVERERKRQEREKEKQAKQIQKLLKQKEKEQNQKHVLKKKQQKNGGKKTHENEQYNREDMTNYCGHCEGFYGDDEEPEEWWQCTKCKDWFHESCTGLFGRSAQLQTYVCSNCVD